MVSVGVTAVGGGVGQAVLQSTNYSRLQWRTVGMDTRPLAPGLYWCDSSYLISPVAEEERYIRDLLTIVEEEHLDLLIPGLDVELAPLARHREVFEAKGCTVTVASEEAVQLSHDKFALHEFCRQRGLPFVPTYSVEGALKTFDAEALPLIAKPRRGKASAGARLIHSREELDELPRDNGLIVQHYLPPPSQEGATDPSSRSLNQSEEWSVQFFVDAEGEILGHFVSINELKAGIPWEIVPRSNPEVVERARSIVEALAEKGLWGPINIQGRETEEGIKFFEANARFTGITGVRASMGYLELDAAVHAFINGCREKAKECLQFNPGFVGTRYVDHTTLPKRRVKTEQEASETEAGSAPKPASSLGDVFITGASGYIGANLIQYLLGKEGVRSIYAGVRDREQGERIRGSFGRPDKLHVATGRLPDRLWPLDGIDTVIHLAAARPRHGKTEDAHFFEINAEGTRRLLEKALRAGVQRFVYVSSQAVYGTQRRPPWSELMAPQPETPYGLSKWIGEQLCASNTGVQLETVVLRVARVFGEGLNMRWDNFPHNFVTRVHRGDPLEVYGDGKQRVDLIHVRDVAAAIERACVAELPSNHHAVFNVGSGNPVSVADLASIVREKARHVGLHDPKVEYRNDQDEQWADFGMDIRRAKAHLDWTPSVTVEAAVGDLIRFYEPE